MSVRDFAAFHPESFLAFFKYREVTFAIEHDFLEDVEVRRP